MPTTVPDNSELAKRRDEHGLAGVFEELLKHRTIDHADTREIIMNAPNLSKYFSLSPIIEDEEGGWALRMVVVVAIAVVAGVSVGIVQRLVEGNFNNLPPMITLVLILTGVVLAFRRLPTGVLWSTVLWSVMCYLEYVIWKNYGISDTSMMALPGVLIVASLILNRSSFAIFGICTILSTALIGYLEISGTINIVRKAYTSWDDVVDIVAILSVTVVELHLLSVYFFRTLDRARNREQQVRIQSEQIGKSKERIQAILQASPAATIITRMEDSTILYVNRAACLLLKKDEPEIVGRRAVELYSEPLQRETLRDVLKEQGYLRDQTVCYRIYDGRTIWASLSTQAIEFDGEEVFLSCLIDVTERHEIELALRDSEEKLKAVVLGSPIPQFVIGKDHNVIFWNRALEILTGVPASSMIGTHNHWKAFYKDERPCFADLVVDNAIQTLPDWYGGKLGRSENIPGGNFVTDFFDLPSAGPKWLRFSAAAVWDAEGDVIGAVETLDDVTKEKDAEEQIRESEMRYRRLFENMPIGLFRSTPDGRLLDCNDAFLEMLGYPDKASLLKTPVQRFYVDANDRIRWKQMLAELRVVRGFETQFLRRDGRVVWVRISGRRAEDAGENSPIYEGRVEDVTESKRAEEAILESEERYRLLVENSGDLVAEVNSRLRFLYISPNLEAVSGYRRAELLKRSVFEILHPEDAKSMRGDLRSGKVNGIFRYRHKDGSWHWMECAGQRFNNSYGQTRAVIIARDITTRKEEEDELKHSREQLQRFSEHLERAVDEERKRISRELHDELGQLLTVLKFNVSRLKAQSKMADEEVVRRLDTMESYIMKSVESVKRIARELRPPQLDELGIVGAIQLDVSQLESNAGFSLRLKIDPPNLRTDRQLGMTLYRVFNESLTNIVRHASAKHVHISLVKTPENIVLEVKDDGRGVRKEELQRGTSLGLVGMRERVRQCNGQLEITGEEGKGTTVKARFPLLNQENERSRHDQGTGCG